MSTFNIGAIKDELENGVVEAAKSLAINTLKIASEDAIAFIESSLPSIERYAELLISSQITTAEFNSLILGLRDLAELRGLTLAGLTAIEIEKTRNGILRAVTSIIIGAVNKAI